MERKAQLASDLCNLLTIMEAKEDAGVKRGNTLASEYTKNYDELVGMLRKEQEDGKEAGANLSRR